MGDLHWYIDGTIYHLHAWTGGIGLTNQARPAHLDQAWYPAFRRIRGDLYRAQVRAFVEYFGTMPDRDTRGIYWGRAGHDAFSTVRQAHEK